MSVEEARTAQRERFKNWLETDVGWRAVLKGDTFASYAAGEASGLREAERIVRAHKDKHANLLAKNVLEMAAAELDERAREAEG